MKFALSLPALKRAVSRIALGATCSLILTSVHATQATDAFAPLSITLQPHATQIPLPTWAKEKPKLEQESDAVLIPVPALAAQDEIGCFALTVVFADDGDGGPVVEWLPKEGSRLLLSAGLGETGIPLGLNARTLLITSSLALDGGTLRVSYAGRFDRVISVTLRPARELSVAALGADFTPSLLGKEEAVLTENEVSGADEILQSGDRTEGPVIHAELSAATRQLDGVGAEGGTEFIIPLGARPKGTLLESEIAGLDPESQIQVSVNGEPIGSLAAAPFSLNAPSTLFSASGRLQRAGWYPTSLFIPSRVLKVGDNSIVLSLSRAAGDEGKSVFLRKARVDLLYSPTPASVPASTPSSPPSSGMTNTGSSQPSVPVSVPIVANPTPTPSAVTPDTLSTGSEYGNPSPSLFHAAAPAVLPTESSQ
jgi:hypothetical protein